MTPISKATPRFIANGIDDKSTRRPIPQPEQIPQHLPLVFLMTQKGPVEPQLTRDGNATLLYGADSFVDTTRYATHQTVLSRVFSDAGNSQLIQRVLLPGARRAMLRLAIEAITVPMYAYQRNDDGSYKYTIDSVGHRVKTPTNIFYGTRLIIRVLEVNDTTPAFSDMQVIDGYNAGTTRSKTGSGYTLGENEALYQSSSPPPNTLSSTLYPIMDIEVTSEGEYGNLSGLKIQTAALGKIDQSRRALTKAVGSFVYRLSCYQRQSSSQTPVVVETILGDRYTDLALGNDIVHPTTNEPLSLAEQFIGEFQELDNPNSQAKYGPFGQIHVYEDSIKQLQTRIIVGPTDAPDFTLTDDPFNLGVEELRPLGEQDFNSIANMHRREFDLSESTANLLNLFTGTDENGAPYHAVEVDKSTLFGGVAITDNTVLYATGGSDGYIFDNGAKPTKLDILYHFDKAVQALLKNMPNSAIKYRNHARYPFTAIWDSGFSLETKYAMIDTLAFVKVPVMLGTYAVADSDEGTDPDVWNQEVSHAPSTWRYKENLSPSEEIALAMTLRTALAMHPESEILGTSVCRAVLVAQSGQLINSTYRGRLPLTIDLASKIAKYMGAGDYAWNGEFRFDESPLNQVTMMRNISSTWMEDSAYDRAWDAGIVWVQDYDHRRYFYPAFQTVYQEDTSVLNSIPLMFGCVVAERVTEHVWRDLTGNSSLSPAQFIQRSDRELAARFKDIFDGRIVVIPQTYFTQADERLGYSWNTTISLYTETMKSVGQATIESNRMSDLSLNP